MFGKKKVDSMDAVVGDFTARARSIKEREEAAAENLRAEAERMHAEFEAKMAANKAKSDASAAELAVANNFIANVGKLVEAGNVDGDSSEGSE